jgi:hypothetical protein
VAAVGESGDVADFDQQPGGTGRSDAVQVQQGSAGRGDQRFEFLVGGLLAGIDPFQVADELGCNSASGFPSDVARSDPGKELLGLRGGQVLLRPTGDQLE